ncbi:MAG: hypothetical protein JXB23_01910, partial [Candidatus Aminicenantes bacterium]|nr:hypothetical protein [Candidatus Aminicenantes bacterium]
MKAEKPKVQDKRSKRKKQVWIGLLCSLTAIIIAGIVYLHSQSFKSFIIKKANAYLGSQYNLALSVQSLDFSIFRLSIVMDNIEVRPASSDKTALFKLFIAKKLSLNTTLPTLLGRKIHVQDLRLISPHLEIEANQAKESSSKTPTHPKKALFLRIDKFLLDNGSVVFSDEIRSISAGISNLRISIDYLEKDKLHTGLISAEAGEIRFGEKSLTLEELNGSFTFDSEHLALHEFAIRLDPLLLYATGKISHLQQSPEYKIDLHGSVQLGRLAETLRLNKEFKGQLSFTSSVEGVGEDLIIAGNITSRNAQVAGVSVSGFEADFDTDMRDLTIDALKITTQKGNLQGKLRVSLTGQKESSAEVEWSAVDLSNFEDLESRFLSILSLVSSGQLFIKWMSLRVNDIQAKGDIRLDPIPRSSLSTRKRYGLEGRLRFEAANGFIQILPSSLKLNRTKFSLSGNIDSAKQFRSEFKVEAEDLTEISGLLQRLSEENIIPEGKLPFPFPTRGRFSLKGTARGSIDAPQVALDISGQDITLKEILIPQVTAGLSYNRTGIEIREFTLELAQGQIQAQGLFAY